MTEAWRDELAHLTKDLGFNVEEQQRQLPQREIIQERPKTKYSAETGRLIPPPSRAMSRGASRQGSRHGRIYNPLQHIAAEPDMESMVRLSDDDEEHVLVFLCSTLYKLF